MSTNRVSTYRDVVSVCIPAYQSASFIERTLDCAHNQTHAAQRIIVSIDCSDDGTEELCRAHARADDRVEVVAHQQRLGWVGNVNFLLDAVQSEFAYIYFHDDVIEPTYTERLLGALERRPDAVSAHCDVVMDDGIEPRVHAGSPYEGSPTERLLNYLVQPEAGALLRSMVRTSRVGRLRMSPAAVVYEMALVAAGPALRVPESLYRRWVERPGGLTVNRFRRPLDDMLSGYRYNVMMAQQVIDELQPSSAEREQLAFGLGVYMSNHLRTLEAAQELPALIDLRELLDPPPDLELPPSASELPDELQQLCRSAVVRIERRTAAQQRRIAQMSQ